MTSPFAQADLAALSSEALTSQLGKLLGGERALLIDFLRHLGEMDRRRLCLELGHSSLFAYLTEHLRLSKASAFRRATAARLLARFPAVADLLADGRLCLTTLCLLKDVLSDEGAAEILERAVGRTEEEVQVLVASLRPKPALPDLIRVLPVRDAAGQEPNRPEAPHQARSGSGPEPIARDEQRHSLSVPEPTPKRTQVTPLNEELRVIRMTVGSQFMAELEAVKSALSHRVPSGSLEALLRECFRITLDTCSRRRHGVGSGRQRARAGGKKPAVEYERPETVGPTEPFGTVGQASESTEGHHATARAARGRYLPVAVRREVWERDGGRCAFVGSNGRRCGSRHRLEFHHRKPFAVGGEATAGNLTLRCAQHNQYEARLDFGDEQMDRFARPTPLRTRAGDQPEPALLPGL
jgi:hypothetical protein